MSRQANAKERRLGGGCPLCVAPGRGLSRPVVTANDTPCRPLGKEVVSGDSRIQRCELSGETWVATASVKGDLTRDFISVQAAEPVSGEGGNSQTRRYQRIGDCPEAGTWGTARTSRGTG